MSWWRPLPLKRSDDEIAARIVAMVNAGEIKPELAEMYERALRSEADGSSMVMRNPGIRPRPPKKPSWER